MTELDQIIEELGYADVVIKPHEWREIAEAYRTNALKEAAEKIEQNRISDRYPNDFNRGYHSALNRDKEIILSLIKDTNK